MNNRPREKGFRRRMIAVLIVVLVILGIFVVRLAQFQLVEKGAYPGSSSSLHSRAQKDSSR